MIHGRPLLNPKYEIFAREYAQHFSPQKAAIASGSKPTGAARQGDRLLKRSDVRKRIDELLNIDDNYYDLLKRRTVSELAAGAFYDVHEFYDLKKLELKQVSHIDGRLIQDIRKNRDGSFSVKLIDKIKCLELIGKHLGMFQDKLDVTTGGESLQVIVNSDKVAGALDAAANE